jgi:hypothetical protein
MKLCWKIAVGLAGAGALCASVLVVRRGNLQKAVEETRLALRQQGFKTELTEFDFSTPSETWARVGALTMIGRVHATDSLVLMMPAGSNAATAVWKHDKLEDAHGDDI